MLSTEMLETSDFLRRITSGLSSGSGVGSLEVGVGAFSVRVVVVAVVGDVTWGLASITGAVGELVT